jgi:hypothetical protein
MKSNTLPTESPSNDIHLSNHPKHENLLSILKANRMSTQTPQQTELSGHFDQTGSKPPCSSLACNNLGGPLEVLHCLAKLDEKELSRSKSLYKQKFYTSDWNQQLSDPNSPKPRRHSEVLFQGQRIYDSSMMAKKILKRNRSKSFSKCQEDRNPGEVYKRSIFYKERESKSTSANSTTDGSFADTIVMSEEKPQITEKDKAKQEFKEFLSYKNSNENQNQGKTGSAEPPLFKTFTIQELRDYLASL